MTDEPVLVTGAGGRIGRVVVDGLAGERPVRAFDLPGRLDGVTGAELVEGDVRDPAAVRAAVRGAAAVVHLGAIADEAPFPDLVQVNVLGTWHVLEAARVEGCRRVVLASTNRVTGRYPAGAPVTPDVPVRPDTFYAVSKVAVEALGRFYADRVGLSVVCLRIGTFEDAPAEARDLSTWLSPADGVALVRRAIDAGTGFAVVYGVSANAASWWGDGGAGAIGHRSADRAEAVAPDLAPVADGDGIQGLVRPLPPGPFD